MRVLLYIRGVQVHIYTAEGRSVSSNNTNEDGKTRDIM